MLADAASLMFGYKINDAAWPIGVDSFSEGFLPCKAVINKAEQRQKVLFPYGSRAFYVGSCGFSKRDIYVKAGIYLTVKCLSGEMASPLCTETASVL